MLLSEVYQKNSEGIPEGFHQNFAMLPQIFSGHLVVAD